MKNLSDENTVIIYTIIQLITLLILCCIPVFFFMYFLFLAFFVYPIILISASYALFEFTIDKKFSIPLVLLIIIIHAVFYFVCLNIILSNNYYENQRLIIMLFEGLVTMLIMIIFMILYKNFQWQYLIYSFSAGFLSLGFELAVSYLYKLGPILNYIFWQLNLSIVINSFIKKVKLKHLNE